MQPKRYFILALAFSLSACSLFPGLGQNEATPPPENTATPEAVATEISQTDSHAGVITLQIWVPPQFAPDVETEAGLLLQARLDEFEVRHPGVRINVRVKAESDEGGLYTSLATAANAAPLALPDLIALPHAEMQLAADKNYILPISSYLVVDTVDDWYAYAEELGDFANIQFGLPFAGDAMVMAYRTNQVENVPRTWQDALDMGGIFSFPAADPLAIFTLVQYQANGGQLKNEDGDPILNERELTAILNLYNAGQRTGLLPLWLTQYDTDELAWQAFRENRAQLTATWYTNYAANTPIGTQIAPLPTLNGETFTYASGWVWALSSPDSQRHAIAVELAEFLSDGDFLAEWNAATGHLPTRPSALGSWQEGMMQAVASQILPTAVMLPDTLTLSSFGTQLHNAIINILKQTQSVEAAVAEIMAEFER